MGVGVVTTGGDGVALAVESRGKEGGSGGVIVECVGVVIVVHRRQS